MESSRPIEPALFEREGTRYLPTRRSLGPWGKDTLHGGPVAGLLAYLAESDPDDPAFAPARLTVDLLRPVPLAPLGVRKEWVREGRIIQLVHVALECEGECVGRANLLSVRRVLSRTQDLPSYPASAMVDRHALEPLLPLPSLETHAASLEIRRAISPPPFALRFGMWIRVRSPLLSGVPLSPLVRAAIVADWTSPCANMTHDGIRFINADLTLCLSRLPGSEWLAVEPVGRRADSGLAICSARIHDELGPFADCLVSSIETGHAITRAAAIANPGGTLPTGEVPAMREG